MDENQAELTKIINENFQGVAKRKTGESFSCWYLSLFLSQSEVSPILLFRDKPAVRVQPFPLFHLHCLEAKFRRPMFRF